MGNDCNCDTKPKPRKKEKKNEKGAPTQIEMKTYVMAAQAKINIYRQRKVSTIQSKRKELASLLRSGNLEIAYEWSLHENGSNDYASLLQQVQLKLDRYRCLQLKVHCQAVEKCDIKLQAKNKKVVDVSAGDGADVL